MHHFNLFFGFFFKLNISDYYINLCYRSICHSLNFIFNILNAISGMCKYDPEKADATLIRFARYLRGNIDVMQEDQLEPFSASLQRLASAQPAAPAPSTAVLQRMTGTARPAAFKVVTFIRDLLCSQLCMPAVRCKTYRRRIWKPPSTSMTSPVV